MDQGPLVSERIVAGEQFIKEFDKTYPVQIAFWLKKPASRWHLHVASSKLSDGKMDAYAEVRRIIREMKNPHFGSFQVKLHRMTDSPVQRALEIQRWHEAPTGHVFPADVFGNLEVEAAYIYPPLKTAAA
jgi:hypothetical protein